MDIFLPNNQGAMALVPFVLIFYLNNKVGKDLEKNYGVL